MPEDEAWRDRIRVVLTAKKDCADCDGTGVVENEIRDEPIRFGGSISSHTKIELCECIKPMVDTRKRVRDTPMPKCESCGTQRITQMQPPLCWECAR